MVHGLEYPLNHWEVANLDWSKTKTIFIIVFSILNIFLFSLYFNKYNEARDMEVPNETLIEDRLFLDNITVPTVEVGIQEASYVSGNVHNFSEEEIESLSDQTIEEKNGSTLISSFDEPLPITEVNTLEKLVNDHILHGNSYGLWKIDEENNEAIFFQKVNNRFVYYNQNAKVTVYWNEDHELVRYEQTILDNLEDYNESKNLFTSMQAIKILYSRGLLKPDSTVKDIKLGYSRLIQLTETQVLQVFAPTWHIEVELSDGTMEEYFVNAVEGRIIEFPKETEQEVVE